jgi:hypothetical protein
MSDKPIAGVLLILGILILWAGFAGRAGIVLGAIFCPHELVSVGE